MSIPTDVDYMDCEPPGPAEELAWVAAIVLGVLALACAACSSHADARPPCNPGGACPCDRDACDCIRDDEADCLARPDLPPAPQRFTTPAVCTCPSYVTPEGSAELDTVEDVAEWNATHPPLPCPAADCPVHGSARGGR